LWIVGSFDNENEFATLKERGVSLSLASLYSGTNCLHQQSAGMVVFLTLNQCKLECEPMPNVMAALPNIGGALCSTPQSLADAQYWSAVQ